VEGHGRRGDAGAETENQAAPRPRMKQAGQMAEKAKGHEGARVRGHLGHVVYPQLLEAGLGSDNRYGSQTAGFLKEHFAGHHGWGGRFRN